MSVGYYSAVYMINYFNLLTRRVDRFWVLHLFTFVSNISMSQTEIKFFVL
jgi:hypothetical protein